MLKFLFLDLKMEMSLLVNLIELIYSPKCKSNFYMTVASLMLIHFWILSTYLIGYLASSPARPSSPPSSPSSTFLQQQQQQQERYDAFLSLNHHHPMWNLIEVVASLLGGIGMAVFFKNMFLIVFESSHLVESGGFGQTTNDSFLDDNSNDDDDTQRQRGQRHSPSNITTKPLLSSHGRSGGEEQRASVVQRQKRKQTLVNLFRREHRELIKAYQRRLLKFVTLVSSNLFVAAASLVFLIAVVSETSLDKLFSQSCIESIVNSTRIQMCPSLFSSEATNGGSSGGGGGGHSALSGSFFSWKHEILNRKISLSTMAQPLSSSIMTVSADVSNVDYQTSGKLTLIQKILPTRAGGGANLSSAVYPFAVKLSPIEDVYIMLICVSLISFFSALIVPVVWVKPTSRIKTATSSNSALKKLTTAESAVADSRIVLRKQREMSLSRELLSNDDDDQGGFLVPSPASLSPRDTHPRSARVRLGFLFYSIYV